MKGAILTISPKILKASNVKKIIHPVHLHLAQSLATIDILKLCAATARETAE